MCTYVPVGGRGAGEWKGYQRRQGEGLPRTDPACASLSVVGNSGNVLLSNNGRKIDAHDLVIRINNAPVKGFEQFVGHRTTFSLCNHYHLNLLTRGTRDRRTSE